MEYFNATYNNNGVISISTNTKWYAVVNGNFRLSKGCGEPQSNGELISDTIDVITDGLLKYTTGSVTFYYGLTNCIKVIYIGSSSKKSLMCDRDSVDLYGDGTIDIVSVSADVEYRISNYFIDKFAAFDIGDNKIMVVSKCNFTIGYDFSGSPDDSYYFVISSELEDKKIYVRQKEEDNSQYLSVSIIHSGKNLYTIKVTSSVNDRFIDFRYSTKDNIVVVKPNNDTLNVGLFNLNTDKCVITIENDYDAVDVVLEKEYDDVEYDEFYCIIDGRKYGYFDNGYTDCSTGFTDGIIYMLDIVSRNITTNDEYGYSVDYYNPDEVSVNLHNDMCEIQLIAETKEETQFGTVILKNDKERKIVVNYTF